MRRMISALASCMIVLVILACNLASGQPASQSNLAATITAQAMTIQAQSGIPVTGATPQPQPADTAQPTNPPPPPADTPQPSAPNKPKNFKAHGSDASINFTWDDNSLDETGFRIYQDGAAAPIADINGHSATGGMSYNWAGLACGFKGKFSIRSYSDNGESGSSNSVDGVTIPCVPTNLIANGQGNAISFNWAVANPHNEDGFHIYQKGVSQPVASRGPNKGSGGTNYDMTGLACNLVATYYVTAFNSAGESPASNLVQTETVPCGPSGLQMTNSTDVLVEFNWTDNATSETGFHIYRDDILVATIAAHSGTGTDSGAYVEPCGHSNVYAIRAFNYAGESTWSEHVGMSTQACP